MIHLNKKPKSVIISEPSACLKKISNPQQHLFNRQINYDKLRIELKKIEELFSSLSIKVLKIDQNFYDSSDFGLSNIFFTRDHIFETPFGIVIGNMANDTRKKEIPVVEKFQNHHEIPILHKMSLKSTFEGADALWINEKLVFVGVGNRTNMLGFTELKDLLNPYGIKCILIEIKYNFPQHLLGGLQIVDPSMAIVRNKLADPKLIDLLEQNGLKVLVIEENTELIEKQAMNFVIINHKEIIMPSDCGNMKKFYETANIKVVEEINIKQIINGGGGLACATCPLYYY